MISKGKVYNLKGLTELMEEKPLTLESFLHRRNNFHHHFIDVPENTYRLSEYFVKFSEGHRGMVSKLTREVTSIIRESEELDAEGQDELAERQSAFIRGKFHEKGTNSELYAAYLIMRKYVSDDEILFK